MTLPLCMNITNYEKGYLLEVAVWRALKNIAQTVGNNLSDGPREPYVRAILNFSGYTLKWNKPNTANSGRSRPDFTILIGRTHLVNIEAHNLNTDFKVSYSWHKKNTLSRFKHQPARDGYLLSSCYNPTATDRDKIIKSFHTYQVTLITLGRQILSEKDGFVTTQVQTKLSPYLSRVFRPSYHYTGNDSYFLKEHQTVLHPPNLQCYALSRLLSSSLPLSYAHDCIRHPVRAILSHTCTPIRSMCRRKTQ